MKADLRIKIKDYRRSKSLKILLYRLPFSRQQFFMAEVSVLIIDTSAVGPDLGGQEGLMVGS